MILLRHLLVCLLLSVGAVRAAEPAHIVFMIGEDEYRTAETLPEFAEKELKPRGWRISIVTADPADPNHFPKLIEALRDADLLFLSVRRRTPPKEQIDAVRAHLAAGRALVGIRTASHAFGLRGNAKPADPKLAAWQEFDAEVLGGNYSNHYGNEEMTTLSLAPGAESHAILKGVDVAKLATRGSLYKVSPLEKGITRLLFGTIAGKAPEPVAWTRRFGEKSARIFYTSLGHPADFQNADFRVFLTNAVAWALEKSG